MRILIWFAPITCKGHCPAVEGKKGFYLCYTGKQVSIAVRPVCVRTRTGRRAYEKTDQFLQRYRWRAGMFWLGKSSTGKGNMTFYKEIKNESETFFSQLTRDFSEPVE